MNPKAVIFFCAVAFFGLLTYSACDALRDGREEAAALARADSLQREVEERDGRLALLALKAEAEREARQVADSLRQMADDARQMAERGRRRAEAEASALRAEYVATRDSLIDAGDANGALDLCERGWEAERGANAACREELAAADEQIAARDSQLASADTLAALQARQIALLSANEEDLKEAVVVVTEYAEGQARRADARAREAKVLGVAALLEAVVIIVSALTR